MLITIVKIGGSTGNLDAVKQLHRSHSRNLGFFPAGAFEDHARAGQILLALDSGENLLGYLLYRVSKGRATIVHLCTAEIARGKGVASALVEHLKRETTHLAGIGLRCRQDYDARYIWAKFGFVAIDRRAGRSYDGHELTFWWFEHPHADLFTIVPADVTRQRVVIDANVFFDLHARETQESECSKALLADWVQESIELCVTKEMLNEIDRATSPEIRSRSRSALTYYPTLKSDDVVFQRLCGELKPLFPDSAALRDESDLRQIAYAIAGDAAYLVSRDGLLNERCDSLYEQYGIQVLHPAELISRLDMLAREEQYRPARVHASHLKEHALTDSEVDWVLNHFRQAPSERASEFRRTVMRFLSRPRESLSRIVADERRNAVLFSVLERPSAGVCDISVLRLAKHLLAPTMLRGFLRSTLDATTSKESTLIRITDPCLSTEVRLGLREFGFVEQGGVWSKLCLRFLGSVASLQSSITNVSAANPESACGALAQATLAQIKESLCCELIAAVELLLWPAKIDSDVLPTFIVPIRAEWAQHFFDEDLAAELLFGLREELHLGVEGVYYCSSRNRYVTAPARILWYVSRGSEGHGSMCIKACSRLEDVVVGKPGELFRRFRRLGAYNRRNVLAAADGNPENDLLALRFSMTERFLCPVSLDVLAHLQIRHPLLSPRKVSAEQFKAIYSHGFGFGVV